MDIRESDINKCRVCLEENVDQHWNEIIYGFTDLTYKDCYYKYTQLEYLDEDNFSAMLCRSCSNSLEFIEAFISKAMKTHIFLQEQFRINMNIKDDVDNIKHEPSFETILVDKTEIKTEIPIHEDQEFIAVAVERNTCSKQEGCSTSLTQTKKQKKRKPKRTKEFDDPTDHIVNGESLLNDKKDTKKIEQSICCSICSKVLSSKYKAILHEKTHLKNRERNETCFECGVKFFSKEILRSHMLTHSENREKAHKCEFCDKAFYYKSGLNIHRRIHLGQMINCSLCTKEFYRQIDLDKHMASHSATMIAANIKTRTKYFVRCKNCGQNVRSTSFKSHTAKHMNEPLFKCSVCNKEFFLRNSCVKHLKKYHKKNNADVIQFIVVCKTNRISSLFLQQNTDIVRCE